MVRYCSESKSFVRSALTARVVIIVEVRVRGELEMLTVPLCWYTTRSRRMIAIWQSHNIGQDEYFRGKEKWVPHIRVKKVIEMNEFSSSSLFCAALHHQWQHFD